MKLVFGIIAACAVLFSCGKQTDCKANIQCLNQSGEPVKNTKVYLYAPVKSPNSSATYTADVKATGTTDENGKVSFVFKLPAVFDIQATANGGNSTLEGHGIVKLEEGRSIEKTLTLK